METTIEKIIQAPINFVKAVTRDIKIDITDGLGSARLRKIDNIIEGEEIGKAEIRVREYDDVYAVTLKAPYGRTFEATRRCQGHKLSKEEATNLALKYLESSWSHWHLADVKYSKRGRNHYFKGILVANQDGRG